jgi:hypothetical protein
LLPTQPARRLISSGSPARLAGVDTSAAQLAALRSAVKFADEFVGPPARWQTRGALGEVAYALGDDETAGATYDEAVALVESFAGALTPERKAGLLAAPPIVEILSLAGRRPAA